MILLITSEAPPQTDENRTASISPQRRKPARHSPEAQPMADGQSEAARAIALRAGDAEMIHLFSLSWMFFGTKKNVHALRAGSDICKERTRNVGPFPFLPSPSRGMRAMWNFRR
jgi:hypothetical protein